ncbi:MAG TPA: trypsin-like peptidase domain-containing protein [Ktedonobacteraceae bacterium]
MSNSENDELRQPDEIPREQPSAPGLPSGTPEPQPASYATNVQQPAGEPAYQPGERPQPMVPARRRRLSNILAGSIIGAMLCLLLGGLVGWQIGKHTTASQRSGIIGYRSGSMTPEQVIAQGRQAVVQINVKTAQGAGVGSGVVIDSQGHIITNDHVVSGGQKYNVVLFDGTSLPASLVGLDAADDLAVVKINPPNKMYVMPIGDSSRLEVGNPVLAIGNPLGITQTVTQGIISALGRTVGEGHGGGTIIDAVQTDAPINPGNSGGALVSMDGNLIGIPTLVAIDPEFKTPANGVGFAVPSNRVKFIAPQLIQYGKVIHSGRAALQASVTTVDPQVAARAGLSVDHGVLVVSTVPGGAAANAGLKTGDVITQVNNEAINNVSDLNDALLLFDPGTTINVNYARGTQQQQQARVKLGELKVS